MATALLCVSLSARAENAPIQSRAVFCSFADFSSSRYAFGPCVVEENGTGERYQWRLRFEDGTAVTIVEDTKEKRAVRSWTIEGRKAIGIEIDRTHLSGASLDRNLSVDWRSESSQPVSTAPMPPSEVQYNPKTARNAQLFNEVVVETRACAREAITGALQLGRRKRDEILSWVAKACGAKLYYVYDTLGRSREEGHAYLIALSERELNDVLGSAR